MEPSSSTTIKRSKSGRNPRKGEGQYKALESSSVPCPAMPKSFNLIVCGATGHKDGFIFSDFMGFAMALREQGVGGDFLSCFPLERHFLYLKNEHETPIDTIKFGKTGPNGDHCVYSYSRHSYSNRNYWFQQVGANILLDTVKDWIQEKKEQAKGGDVVNMVFECHGAEDRGLKIGHDYLHRHVFGTMISGFRDGVQVNAIMDACYSGPFVGVIKDSTEEYHYAAVASDEEAWSFTRSSSNRVRNSRFSQAFVQSLAKLNLPGAPRRKVTWKLKDHEDLIRNMTMRNITPGANAAVPRFHASPPLDGMSAVEDMVFRRKVDVLFDPRDVSGRRRIEWPTQDQNTWQIIQGDPESEQVPQYVKTVVDEELSKCDASTGFVPDIQVLDEVYVHHPRYRSLMRNLYWRARRQFTIWQIFKLLLHRAYIDPACLRFPVDFDQYSTSDKIKRLLTCFSFVFDDHVLSDDIPFQSAQWDKDLKWLAVMIVRGGKDIDGIFNLITASGMLGDCILQRLDEYKQEHPEFTFHQIPDDCLCQPDRRFNHKFGLWLPHGLAPEQYQTLFAACEQHFSRIESASQQSEPQLAASVDHSETEDNEVLAVPVEWSPASNTIEGSTSITVS